MSQNARIRMRRLLRRLVDPADWAYRQAVGRVELPPYSLRQAVGGARGFTEVGTWFRDELTRLGLLRPRGRLLEVGCGCGRIALALARSRRIAELDLRYVGMDVDRRAIAWCRRVIEQRDPRFHFYRADIRNGFYNPRGRIEAARYTFPYDDGSFDAVVLASVFTHMTEAGLVAYLREIHRLCSPAARIYASFFTFGEVERPHSGHRQHPIGYPHVQGNLAVHSAAIPEMAVAYEAGYLMRLLCSLGFEIVGDVLLGIQDVLLLTPASSDRRTDG